MAVSVYLPKSGMGISEGTIVKWLKQVGDPVTAGEAIVEVETAKSTIEVEAPASGVLSAILVTEDETVEVEGEIATIEES